MSTTVLIMVTHASSLGLPEKYTPFTCGSFVCGDFPALLWQPVLAPHALTPLLLPFAPCAARHLSPPPPPSQVALKFAALATARQHSVTSITRSDGQ